MKVHIWRRVARSGVNGTWCNREEPMGRHLASPYGDDLLEATCTVCVRARRDNALWVAQREAEAAKVATAHLDSLRRRASRRKRSGEVSA